MKSDFRFTWTLVSLVLLSACGGGAGKITDSSKSAALDACTPSSGAPGTSVVCAAKGMTEDSTLFFDKKPVEFALNEEEGTVSFDVPPTLVKEKKEDNEKDIYFQEGDTGVRMIGSFEVTGGAPAGSEDVAPAGSDAGGGTSGTTTGETINPTETSGGTTGGSVPLPPPDADGDGVPDTSDACPGTVQGTAVDSTGCVPPPPQPTSASIDAFTVTKVTDGTPRLVTFKVNFAYSNAKAAYIWGNMLNRTPGDGDLPAGDAQCKAQGSRYLITNPDGTDINPASANFAKLKYLTEGTLCGASNCQSGGPTALLEDPTPNSRFNDRLAKRDRYAYQPMQVMPNLSFDAKDKMYLVNPGYLMLLEKNPNCRVDLEGDDGNPVFTGEFYTRSRAQYGKLCLAVQGKDDQWKVQCLTGDKVNAPTATIGEPNVSVSSKKPSFSLHFSATNVTGIDVKGCTQNSLDVPPTGKGSYDGDCEINAVDKEVTVTVSGVGEHNTDMKKYAVHLDKPVVTLKVIGSEPSGDGEADFGLAHKAVRDYTIKEKTNKDAVVASGKAHWFQSVTFSGYPSGNGTHAVSAPEDTDGNKTAHWSPSQTSWTYGVKDFDGTDYTQTWSKALKKTISVTFSPSNNGGMELVGGGACNTTPNLRLYMMLVWTGTNVKSISSSDCGIDGGSSDTSSVGKYGEHSGYLKAYSDFGQQSDTWDRELTCTITGTYLDGDTFSRSMHMTGFSCH